MDVTRQNFKQCLEDIFEAIEDASFLSLDCEFTGLTKEQNANNLDTVEERYRKLYENARDFQLAQVGLAVFKYNKATNSYAAKAFNFYVFPRPFSRQAPDRRFLCQSSSVDFLATHGFDFNKWIYEGIPYLPHHEENRLREALEQKHANYADNAFASPAFSSPIGGLSGPAIAKGPTEVPDEQKEFLAEIEKRVEEFIQSKKNSEEDSMCLETSINAFQRKLIYQTIQLKFRNSVHLETKHNDKKQRFIVVSRIECEEDRKKKEAARRQAEFDQLDDAVGFARVVKKISESGKVVVGHNMLLDLIHVINHFNCPLPQDYGDFKEVVKSIFPQLLDTKVMATSHPYKEHILNTALSDLQKVLELKPFTKPEVEMADGFEKYSRSSEPLHEAGYDAFITGLCFIGLSNYLGTFQKPEQVHVPPTSSLIQPFVNKVNVRMLDIPYLNLAGPDLQPSRDHVFHISFPASWKISDLFVLFNPFGTVQVCWIDETSAFIVLHKKEEAPSVLKQLAKGQGDLYRIMTFSDFKRQASSRKRPRTPESDVDLPSKKTKSLNVQASPFQSRYSITPIPEEESEEIGQETKTGTDQVMKGESPDTTSDKEKLFEEPETW